MTIFHAGWRPHALLTPQQAGEADRLTISGDIREDCANREGWPRRRGIVAHP
jgi:hypothetical protein